MTEKPKAPAIRFKGFTDVWEQRKFSEITYPAGEKNHDDLPLESYSITNENGFVPQNIKFENGGMMRAADKRMYYIVSPNSFAYNPARINVGSIGYQNLNKNVIVSSLYEVFKTTDEIDDRFLWHWFKSPNFQKLIEQLQEGGVRLYFYYDKLCMGTFSFPSIKEQMKIGKLLDNLDKVINLHQRKFEKLQNVKKAMLEKMFPKNGSDIPEIRFTGFTDAWEQRRFGEIVKNHNAGIYISKENYGVGTNIIGVGNIYDSDVVDGEIYRLAPVTDDSFLLDENDLIYGESSIVPEGIARTMCVTKNGVGTAFAWHTRRVKIDNNVCNSHFITLELNYHENVRKYLMRASTQTALTGMTTEGYFGAEITYPSVTEQEHISRFFRCLDSLITLHQRKLEKLQNVKKACLEKMFV